MMIEWLESHKASVGFLSGIAISVILWFVRLEVRLSKVEGQAAQSRIDTTAIFTKLDTMSQDIGYIRGKIEREH